MFKHVYNLKMYTLNLLSLKVFIFKSAYTLNILINFLNMLINQFKGINLKVITFKDAYHPNMLISTFKHAYKK